MSGLCTYVCVRHTIPAGYWASEEGEAVAGASDERCAIATGEE